MSKLSKAERTRRKIIEQSAELFNRKGFAGTSVKDIMDETGLSKGGLYSHFSNGKEKIALAAFHHAVNVVYNAIGERTHQFESATEKLKAVVNYYRENIFTPPVQGGCPIQNASIDADETNPVMKREVAKALTEWQERIVHTLNKGIECNEIRKDIDKNEFSIFFMGAIEGGILMARAQNNNHFFEVMARAILKRIEEIEVV